MGKLKHKIPPGSRPMQALPPHRAAAPASPAVSPPSEAEKPLPLDVDIHIRVKGGQIGFPEFAAPSLDITYDLAIAILDKAKNQILDAKGRLVLRHAAQPPPG